MTQRFLGIFRHELGMALRRKGLWIAYGLLFPGQYTPADAILNLAVLGLCIAAVLLLLERLLRRQARRA